MLKWVCRGALRLVSVLLLCGSALSVQAGLLFSPDPDWSEAEISLPPVPDRDDLEAFAVEAGNPNRHYIDRSSLSVGADGVVRYVLVIVAAGGAENVSYEGLRCASAQWRRYASADADGQWQPARKATWQAIGTPAYNRPRATLAYDHFCDGSAAPHDREHALRLLRHPRNAARREAVR